jgi:hypothetical protein
LGCGLIVAPFAAAISYGGLKQVVDFCFRNRIFLRTGY